MTITKVTTQFPTVLKKETAILTTVSSGVVGERGPSGGELVERVSDIAISGHRIVVSSGTGKLEYADNTILNHQFRILGLTLNAASPGNPIDIRVYGEVVEPSWSFTPGPVFLGTNGNLTQVQPSGTSFSMIVGYAVDSTTLIINIQQPINIE